MEKYKIAFVCVHNSCRSQMAEAIAKLVANDMFEVYSAGTVVVDQINPKAVEVIQELYQIDMNQTQYSKLINILPAVDIVITMGCNVQCPQLPCKYREDWGIEDPCNKEKEDYIAVATIIENYIYGLKKRLAEGLLT